MKKLAVLFFVFAMSVTTTFANNEDDKRKEEVKVLRTKIVQLLGNYTSKETVKAEVTFMINRQGEIIVLSVEADNSDVEGYVKASLNYKSVEKKVAIRMKVYRLPLTIKKA